MQKIIMSFLVSALLIAGCSGDPRYQNEEAGGVTGAIAGGLLGSTLGSGFGQTAAILGGALMGNYMGAQVGHTMDQVDQQTINKVTTQAMWAPTQEQRRWHGPHAHGHIIPVSDVFYYDHRPCRKFRSEVITKRYHKIVSGVACYWEEDRAWHVVDEVRTIRRHNYRPIRDYHPQAADVYIQETDRY